MPSGIHSFGLAWRCKPQYEERSKHFRDPLLSFKNISIHWSRKATKLFALRRGVSDESVEAQALRTGDRP